MALLWRNVISTSGDDTKVDIKRPTSPRAAPASAKPPWMLSPDPGPEKNDTTVPIARVPWPEPPRNLSERPRTKTNGIALSRTIGGFGRLPPFSSWFAHVVALSAATIIGFFLMRAPRHASIGSAVAPSPAVGSLAPAPPAPPSPTALPAAATTSAALPRSTKPPIDVSSLPVAPPLRVTQPPRNKRSTPKQFVRPLARPADVPTTTVRTPPARPPSAAPLGSAGNDGF
jgi:hypothetical protein